MVRFAGIVAVVCISVLALGSAPSPAAFPGENGSIAFDSDRGGSDFDIWTVGADGRKSVNLTADSEAFDELASWRADGREIVFMSNRETAGNPPPPGQRTPDYEIFVMNADGSNPRQVTFNEFDDEDPAFSPDGTQIAIRRDMNPVRGKTDYDIVTMASDGSGETNLTNSRGVSDDHPNWSPDGTRIAFASDRAGDYDVFTMDPDGSNARRLTHQPSVDEHPNWSPDGTRIAFNSDRGDNLDIYTKRAIGGGLKRLTFHREGDAMPAWSPDGRLIAFASSRDGCCDIFTMRANGRREMNLTNSDAALFVPDWQPLVD